MKTTTALVAALLSATLAASPAWSQGAGGGGGSATGGADAGSSNRDGAAGAREDNSGRGPNQPGNRSANEPTNSQNQMQNRPNVQRPTTPQAGQPIPGTAPSAQVPAQRPAAPTAQNYDPARDINNRNATAQNLANQQSIVDLQQALNKNGAKIKVDGKMGPETRGALRQYQQQNNLRVTGSLDAETRAKLRV
jgi:hypothetical protein